jgi:uncharacterized protein
MSDAAAPASEQRRIQGLDVVRGFALLGILAVNAVYFAAPYQAAMNPLLPPVAITPDTAWTWLLMHVGFELKMVTLFSMLFGASIYLVGGETDDYERGHVLRRRLAWLFVFGLIHGSLIWHGDILLTYAVTGLGVMFVRAWPARALLANGVILYGLSVVLVAAAMALAPVDADEAARLSAENWAPPADVMQRTVDWFAGDALSSLHANISTWWIFTTHPYSLLFIARTAALMMIGMALLKWGFFAGVSPKWLYVLLILLGGGSLIAIAWQAERNVAAHFNFMQMSTVGQAANNVLSPLVSLAYASVLILAVKFGVLRRFTDALAAVGRMAFTNYIAQSLIMTCIFYGGRGPGLFGQVDRETLWLIVFGVWALQLVWSQVWLARFQMGPLEWLWRRLSLARPVAISR